MSVATFNVEETGVEGIRGWIRKRVFSWGVFRKFWKYIRVSRRKLGGEV